jgi:hypothetical protein
VFNVSKTVPKVINYFTGSGYGEVLPLVCHTPFSLTQNRFSKSRGFCFPESREKFLSVDSDK